jgi:hypothetical protein
VKVANLALEHDDLSHGEVLCSEVDRVCLHIRTGSSPWRWLSVFTHSDGVESERIGRACMIEMFRVGVD